MRFLLIFILLVSVAYACYEPSSVEPVNSSVVFCSDTFDVFEGLRITRSDIVVDCNSAIVRGLKGVSDSGFILEDISNVTLRGCNVVTFTNGILLDNVSFSHVHHNNLLKNDVGIRLFDSFENSIVDNNDKSLVKSISAINSKFNTVSLGNKGVEEGFCDVNSCDGGFVSPCVDGDGYCSPSCGDADSDCVPVVIEAPVVDNRSADEIIEDIEKDLVTVPEPVPVIAEEPVEAFSLAWPVKLAIYALFYVCGFFLIQFAIFRRRL